MSNYSIGDKNKPQEQCRKFNHIDYPNITSSLHHYVKNQNNMIRSIICFFATRVCYNALAASIIVWNNRHWIVHMLACCWCDFCVNSYLCIHLRMFVCLHVCMQEIHARRKFAWLAFLIASVSASENLFVRSVHTYNRFACLWRTCTFTCLWRTWVLAWVRVCGCVHGYILTWMSVCTLCN